jgi:DNA-binding NarL/FixJ family response regulator
VKPTDQVSQLISSLTNDEDQRQELWAYYLSGNSESTLASYFAELNKDLSLESEIQSRLWRIVKNPPSEKFHELLSRFSEIEQSIVTLLALGLTVAQVSRYKGISEIRIRQVVSIIKDNDCWEELYGIKETSDTGRKVRA